MPRGICYDITPAADRTDRHSNPSRKGRGRQKAEVEGRNGQDDENVFNHGETPLRDEWTTLPPSNIHLLDSAAGM
jgi:hypothetical protein